MTKEKVELKLDKGAVFKIAGFISELDLQSSVEKVSGKLNGETSEQVASVVGIQIITDALAKSETKVYELFAELAGVELDVIRELDVDEFFDLVEDFLAARLIKRASKLAKILG